MSTLGNRIRELREQHNLTQTELAQELGMKTYTTVSKWESNDNFPKGKDLKRLAELFNVSSDFLLGLDSEQKKSSITAIYDQLQPFRKNEVLSFAEHQLREQNKIYNLGASAAGPALDYTDDFVEEEELEYIPEKANFILTIKGDSMEPEIPYGSKVFVQSTQVVENGEIAIVEVEGDGVTCKRVKYDFDKRILILQSLNPKYDDIIFDNKQIKIIGKVIK